MKQACFCKPEKTSRRESHNLGHSANFPSLFFSEYWLREQFLDEGLQVIVEAHEAAAEQEAHVATDVGDEAVGVVDDILLPFLEGSLSDDNLKSKLTVSAVGNEL